MVMKTTKRALDDRLSLVRASDEANARLGPDSSAIVDYLLYPPEGYPIPGAGADWGEKSREEVMQERNLAIQRLNTALPTLSFNRMAVPAQQQQQPAAAN